MVEGRCIVGVGRRGKAPLLFLDAKRPVMVVFRLGMTGLLRLAPVGEAAPKGAVATLHLGAHREPGSVASAARYRSNERNLHFVDQRRFGSLAAYPGHDPDETPEFEGYGPEPFSDALTLDYLKQALARRKAKLDLVLMDQHVIAGIGKIYSDEICFRAGIRPGRAARSLTAAERERLFCAIREVLEEGIGARGSSARDETYRDLYGIPGRFQDRMYVYQRAGESCRVCGTAIRRTAIPGGRGMHWCPKCQR